MDWTDLPKPAFIDLFRRVGIKHGAGACQAAQCALVCCSWAEAAAEVTNSVVISAPREEHLGGPGLVTEAGRLVPTDASSLQLWLKTHGSSISKLHVGPTAGDWLQLPCPNLQDLLLHQCSVGPGAQLCSSIAGVTLLSSLVLDDLTTYSSADHSQLLATVTGLSALQRLTLGKLRVVPGKKSRRRLFPELPAAILLQLQQLPQLTHLELATKMTAGSLQHLGGLTRLQRLQLQKLGLVHGEGSLSGLQHLHRLTYLQLQDLSCGALSSPAPGLSKLTALQRLLVSGVPFSDYHPDAVPSLSIHPTLPASMPSLQKLVLANLQVDHPHVGAAHAALLMAAVLQLQQLTELVLHNVIGLQDYPDPSFAAITSSSKLQRLTLSCSRFDRDCFRRFWPYAMPLHPQPQLTRLCLSDVTPGLTVAQMWQLPCLWPNLVQLDVHCAFTDDWLRGPLLTRTAEGRYPSQVAWLEPLLRLQRLEYLCCASNGPDFEVLKRMTWLRHLFINNSQRWDAIHTVLDSEVLCLTALKQLTVLDLTKCSLSHNLSQQLDSFTVCPAACPAYHVYERRNYHTGPRRGLVNKVC